MTYPSSSFLGLVKCTRMDFSKGKTYITSICYPLQACFPKIIGVLARNGGGKMEPSFSYVGSMLLLNMALVCIRVRLGKSHSVIFPPWVCVISFDLSFSIYHVIMTLDPLMSNTVKSSVVSLICSREFFLCSYQPSSDSLLVLIHYHHVPLSRVDDVGNIMALLRPDHFLSTSAYYLGS